MKKLTYITLICLLLFSCNTSNPDDDSEINALLSSLEESENYIEELQERIKTLESEIDNLNIQMEKKNEDNISLISVKELTEDLLEEKDNLIEVLKNELLSMENELNGQSGLKNIDVLSVSDKILNYIVTDENNANYTVNIIGFESEQVPIYMQPTKLSLNSPGTGEVLKLQVLGSIYDFQVVEVEWDESLNELKEVQIIEEISQISNAIVEIDTYLNCGIPNGKLKWRNSEDEEIEFYLSQDGVGFSGSIIISK